MVAMLYISQAVPSKDVQGKKKYVMKQFFSNSRN